MGVQIALEVGALHQPGQGPLAGGLDLALALAQLRRDVGQAHGLEHGLLGLAGHPALAPEHPVFVDLEACLLAQAADLDVVGLAAGEIVQGGAEAGLLHGAQVHLQAAAQDHRGPGGALGDHLGHLVVGREALHDGVFWLAVASTSRSPTVSLPRR